MPVDAHAAAGRYINTSAHAGLGIQGWLGPDDGFLC